MNAVNKILVASESLLLKVIFHSFQLPKISYNIDEKVAALEHQLHEDNAASVKARVIVEGANEPTTAEAAKVLHDKGIFIVSDILANAVEVVLPEEIALEEAIRINFDGIKHEGVEEIKDDGTVVLTDEAYGIQKELYGLALREHRFEDMEDIAKELIVAGKKLVAKYS